MTDRTPHKTAIVTKLNADEGISEIVGNRIDWGKRPNGERLPAIVLKVRADPRPRHMKGFQGLRKTTVQIDVYSDQSQTQAADIVEMIIGAIGDPWRDDDAGVRFERSDFEGPDESGENSDEGYVYRARLDAEIWHAKT